MASALLQKLLKARTLRVEAGGFVFEVLRPTPLEREEKLRGDRSEVARGILSLVVGWEGVKELDLIPGGDPHPLPFDVDACAAWLADRPDLFAEISAAVVQGFEDYIKRLDDSLKN